MTTRVQKLRTDKVSIRMTRRGWREARKTRDPDRKIYLFNRHMMKDGFLGSLAPELNNVWWIIDSEGYCALFHESELRLCNIAPTPNPLGHSLGIP